MARKKIQLQSHERSIWVTQSTVKGCSNLSVKGKNRAGTDRKILRVGVQVQLPPSLQRFMVLRPLYLKALSIFLL